MRLFDWLKPRQVQPEDLAQSALAQIVNGREAHPEAWRIADSLRDFPGDWAWEVKGYRLKHAPTGFRMWVANGERHLAECTEGKDVEFSPKEQAIIWKAVQPWMDSFKVGFTGRLPKVRIHGERGLYWCAADGHPWAGGGKSPAHAYRSWAQAVSAEQRQGNPKNKLHVWSDPL